MSLLLDTHVVLWWLTDATTLTDDVKERLDHEPDVYVSAATLWEVGIKQSTGKLKAPTDLAEQIRGCGFRALQITFEHAVAAGRLPLLHRDPFDRMLIAQAQCEDLTLATRDASIRAYDVTTLDV
ncbi:type II toxin-antitoxin system VapC family toxin [Frankia sp. AgB1.9]|uniref:type II toxin-antitoxin system VapC family toxin n=1 Tax=unclassified Frankia TaxID=2632575 RepID=UPI001932AD84|nr:MULTISPECIES: type II toxin-antitoxin system VapC family toxin [unclassified Frankia]MBL7489666.1 type II toxin-antitoxin system VapC family toxin [Frankia sp. AgW1.1]MBL7550739.1 type II toxin-antitoxin system VapC family toxin [Frankia sp. AgB1.9]MBL7624356.1 type II toxin-antitoxin system VapC family toxin [Frankia sp. AgB1.8]